MSISTRVASIQASASVVLHEKVIKLKNQGKEIIALNVGETDLPTPQSIIQATIKALEKDQTKYGSVSGELLLKKSIAQAENKNYQTNIDESNILVSTGSKQSIYNVFQSIIDPEDEVIVIAPYWNTYKESIKLAGGHPVIVSCKSDFQLDLTQIQKALSTKTKAIIINTPNNPSGAVYHKEDLEALCHLSKEKDLYLISDEAYEQLVYDDELIRSLAQVNTYNHSKIIYARSFSKAYIMTGFRVGYLIADSQIINSINKLQSHLTGNICTFAQYGALSALSSEEEMKSFKNLMKEKRDLSYSLFSQIFDCPKPQGGFYLYLNIEKYLTAQRDSALKVAEYILDETQVALLPAEAFGHKKYLRLSFCVANEKLEESFKRLETLFSK